MFKLLVGSLIVCICLTQIAESFKIIGLSNDELQNYENVAEFENKVIAKRQASDESCTPGTTFKVDCNTCLCGPDGTTAKSACTLIGCPPSNTFIVRTPN